MAAAATPGLAEPTEVAPTDYLHAARHLRLPDLALRLSAHSVNEMVVSKHVISPFPHPPHTAAIDAPTSREMGDVFAAFRDDPELRVAILTGGGDKFFCPGWDLKAAAAGEGPTQPT